MSVDPTVAAVPFYFGSMAAERAYLERRAEREGPSAAQYTRPDTVASLSMGVASLVVPLLTHRLIAKAVPGRNRLGRTLLGVSVVAAAATTAADAVLARSEGELATEPTPAPAPVPSVGDNRLRRRMWARRVAAVGGVTAIGTGVLAVTTAAAARTEPRRMWAKGRSRDLGAGPLAWLAAIAGWDFIYYWNHRFMHEVRGMWAIHVVHHSSERYNLSTALRQPVADVLGLWVPYGLLSRLGVRPSLVAQARGINLLYQYWIHTDAIDRLGPAEEMLNTPSHHRVHHGRNPKYIDRNHGSILIVWDRLFGTFQREEEPVVYGLTKNIGTYDPARIATHEYLDIARDVAGSTNWHDRLSFVFRGPGWAYRRHAEAAAAAAG